LKKTNFYKKLIALAVPIILQQLIAASLNLVDNLMIGQLGEESIASVGIANQVYFIVILFIFGITGGASIFFAQFWGKKDLDSIHKTLGVALMLTLISSAAFTLAAAAFPRFVIGIFSADPAVIEAGSQYISIAALSYIPYAISSVFFAVFRSTGRPRIPLFTSAIALALNTLLNYMLILGNFGMPALGVRGAAIATLTARLVEVTIILLIAYNGKNHLGAKITELFSFSRLFFKKLMSKMTLVILNDGIWGLGTAGYTIMYARMGTGVIAAMTIANTLFNFLFIFALGIGSGLAIMVGNSLGADKFDQAKRYAHKGIIAAALTGVFVALVMLVFRDIILSLYSIQEDVLQNAKDVTNILMLILPVICIEFTLFIGVLRSGGDTLYCAVVDLSALFFVGLPLALVGAFVFHWPLPIVYLLARSETIVRAVASFIRYKTNIWVKNVT
jgi:putative MATE family efflux protein